MNAPAVKSWLPGNMRDRRIIAIALLLLVCALMLAAIIVPVVLLHRHYDDNIGRMSRQLKSQSALNAAKPQLVRALDSLKARDTRKLFLRGTTSALASAELQDQVKQVIESAGGRVLLVQGAALKEDGPYRLVAATFHLNASSSNLRRVLYALELREPYLFIDNLTIRATVPSGFKPQPNQPEPEVFVQMDVSGISQVADNGGVQSAARAGVK